MQQARREQLQIACHFVGKNGKKPPTVMEIYAQLAPDDPLVTKHYKSIEKQAREIRENMVSMIPFLEKKWGTNIVNYKS